MVIGGSPILVEMISRRLYFDKEQLFASYKKQIWPEEDMEEMVNALFSYLSGV
jgi:hypothetical protein